MTSAPRISASRNEAPADAKVIEAFTPSLEELFFVRNPQFRKGMTEAEAALKNFLANSNIRPVWIYYPEHNVIVYSLPEAEYLELRTARNRNIITAEEQAAYRACALGIAGLSVGSAILRSLVMTGGPKRMKIADPDTLAVSNLNRLNATLMEVGENKTAIAARRVWEMDPFAELSLRHDGVTPETLQGFLGNKPVLDIFIDAMDAIPLKIQARVLAKARRIPVLMATDNGDGVILDVERFDEEPERPVFHGLLESTDLSVMGNVDRAAWVKLATKIVGPEYLPERMQESILAIGKTLSAVPQLGSSAEIAGAAVAFAVRRIASQAPLPSGRYTIHLEEKLVPGYGSETETQKRKAGAENFKRRFEAA